MSKSVTSPSSEKLIENKNFDSLINNRAIILKTISLQSRPTYNWFASYDSDTTRYSFLVIKLILVSLLFRNVQQNNCTFTFEAARLRRAAHFMLCNGRANIFCIIAIAGETYTRLSCVWIMLQKLCNVFSLMCNNLLESNIFR